MKKICIIIYSLALAFIISPPVQAQQKALICREPVVSKEQIQKLIRSRQKAMANRSLASTQKQLRVYFHIVRNDNGTSASATFEEVDKEFQTLLNDFSAGNICFIKAGVGFIDNTELNNIDVDENDDAEDLFEARTIPGCLNVFFVYNIRGENNNSGGKIGGLVFDIPATFCLVGKDYLGRNTTSHEIGHSLGLFHTYDDNGFGDEFINGDDCQARGDFICDTKADPYSYALDDCFSSKDGFYTGNCEDPDGKTNFSPPYNNIMSYWHHNPETFTPDQFTAVRATIEDEDMLQNVSSTQTFTFLSITYTFGFVYRSALGTVQTIGPVEFAGASTGGIFGSQVLLTPGFHAHSQLPLTIAATQCNTVGAVSIAAGKEAPAALSAKTGVSDNIMAGKLNIYPNPASQYFNIDYEQPNMFNALITVRNTAGALIFSSNKKNTLKIHERIDVTGKARGIYFVEIITDKGRLTAKVIIQ